MFRLFKLILIFLCTSMPLMAHAAGKADLAVAAPVMSCADLGQTDISALGGVEAKITAQDATSDGIEVCSVEGTLAPAIRFHILLPKTTWTQRYLQIGCGGLCGNISLTSGASNGCETLNDGGFVLAATDMGHEGNGVDWLSDPQKKADFAYVAQHQVSKLSHQLMQAYYGQDAKYAYFNGCSDGGREALMEAQRYPDDFDGVVAGAPAMLFQVQNTLFHGWQAVSNMDAQGEVILRSDKLPLLHAAVVKACDALDGVEDGIVAQPAVCDFDPMSIACPEGTSDESQCLTKAEAQVAAKFYAGPKDPATGAPLTAGQPLYGSELNWQGVYVADDQNSTLFSKVIVMPVLQYMAFAKNNADYQLSDLKFDTATLDALKENHPFYDATNPDLSAFRDGGGKLILWHGLADQHISPANTVEYQKAMIAQMGQQAVDGFERLYLLPGVAHCGGGQGPSHLNLLDPMMAWVEGGEAPDAIMTSTAGSDPSFGPLDGAQEKGGPPPAKSLGVTPLPEMTRPVYPWPHVAQFSGQGDYTDAANWSEGPETEVVATHDWPGANFFAPYDPKMSVAQ